MRKKTEGADRKGMDWQAVLRSIDDLVFQQTGKHLDNLQVAILKGVLNGQKYAEIARQYKCTSGHVKDEGYKLWQVLSEVLGEDLNKSNFCATVERLGIANSHSRLINPVQIGHLNLCDNQETSDRSVVKDSNQTQNLENTQQRQSNSDFDLESALRDDKIQSASNLAKLSLTAEQIADALDLPLDDVREAIKSNEL